MPYRSLSTVLLSWAFLPLLSLARAQDVEVLPGTKPLTIQGDLAKHMVAGIDRYLMKALEAAPAQRQQRWKLDTSSPQAYETALDAKRKRLKQLLGIIDDRMADTAPRVVQLPGAMREAAQSERINIYEVRWPTLPGMEGEGLLVVPRGRGNDTSVILLPDADMEPERLTGQLPQVDPAMPPLAKILAEQGCTVLVPVLIDRKDTWSANPKIGRATNQPHREFVYRMAYEMGRHIIGYEVQKVLAAVDWCSASKRGGRTAVIGYGEGGVIALYAGALDARIQVTAVSGSFGKREQMWREPIYRNVWGQLRDFGDGELAAMVAPRALLVYDTPGPLFDGPPKARAGRGGAAPGGTLHRQEGHTGAAAELKLAELLSFTPLKLPTLFKLTPTKSKAEQWLDDIQRALAIEPAKVQEAKLTLHTPNPDSEGRQKRQFEQAVDFTQKLLPDAVKVRDKFWSKLNTTNLTEFQKSVQPYRDYFGENIIGNLPKPNVPMNVRTRLIYDEPKWKGYEVVLDLYEDVICYGILLVPKDIKPGEKRPCVVCQHGLEGRPTDVCNPKMKTPYYHSFGAQLADRGFVVFAPQNPYIGRDDFRVLIRKGHPLGISLYSFIVQQHERILDFLETLPYVDGARIAFYGLSYGGKVAMRIPALVGRYCAVICSGDFNEWIWKNINLIWGSSYMFTMEYDMYEFDLGNTFNYAEMAYLIAPRPFMVERGHDDGVGLDEWVAHEYARVRRMYARLGLAERTEIEFFSGGHIIYGQGTFAFLHRHLRWPAPAKQ